MLVEKLAVGGLSKRTGENIDSIRLVIVVIVAQQINLSYSTCQLILKKNWHYYAYNLICLHELLPVDYPRVVEFCQWQQNNLNNEDILNTDSFSDEVWFYLFAINHYF